MPESDCAKYADRGECCAACHEEENVWACLIEVKAPGHDGCYQQVKLCECLADTLGAERLIETMGAMRRHEVDTPAPDLL